MRGRKLLDPSSVSRYTLPMLSIRLQRVGKKNRPTFRMVLTDKRRSSKSGSFLEWLGSVDRIAKTRSIDKDRVTYWISKGAQCTDTAHNLLVAEGIITGEKRFNHSRHASKKTIKKNETTAGEKVKAEENAAKEKVAQAEAEVKTKEEAAVAEVSPATESASEEISAEVAPENA